MRDDGSVKCWGFGTDPGRDNLRDVGQTESMLGPFSEVSTWSSHTCGRLESGAIECWGSDGLGQSDPESEYGAEGCERVDHGDYGVFECSPLCQRGCAADEACIVTRRAGIGWVTWCSTPGDNADGETCSPNEGYCQPGSGCVGDGSLTGTCREFCRNDPTAER